MHPFVQSKTKLDKAQEMRKHKQNRNKKKKKREEEVIDRDIHHPAYAVYETVVLGSSPPFRPRISR
jgi:hypothetical protein